MIKDFLNGNFQLLIFYIKFYNFFKKNLVCVHVLKKYSINLYHFETNRACQSWIIFQDLDVGYWALQKMRKAPPTPLGAAHRSALTSSEIHPTIVDHVAASENAKSSETNPVLWSFNLFSRTPINNIFPVTSKLFPCNYCAQK